jgi:hypothetical protein
MSQSEVYEGDLDRNHHIILDEGETLAVVVRIGDRIQFFYPDNRYGAVANATETERRVMIALLEGAISDLKKNWMD